MLKNADGVLVLYAGTPLADGFYTISVSQAMPRVIRKTRCPLPLHDRRCAALTVPEDCVGSR